MEQHSSDDRSDWFGKAKSRLWSKKRPEISAVPSAALLAGTFFYTGLSPFASGTVGSLAAAILYYAFPGMQNPIVLFLACLVVLVIGIWASNIIERTMNVQDPGIIVIDEVLGQWIALLTLNHVFSGQWSFVLVAFLFFRLFDILKPWPARYFEKKEGGAGVMLDDAVAGIYANIATHLVMFIIMRAGHISNLYERP